MSEIWAAEIKTNNISLMVKFKEGIKTEVEARKVLDQIQEKMNKISPPEAVSFFRIVLDSAQIDFLYRSSNYDKVVGKGKLTDKSQIKYSIARSK